MKPPTKFSIGDRVIITGTHPWAGYAGKIVHEYTAYDFDWKVSIDGSWTLAACSESELEKI